MDSLSDGTNMPDTTLQEIDAWLAENRPDYHAILNPPADQYLFDALRATIGLSMPDELKRFYQWHDGQQAGTFDSLLENLTFMTLMEIATTHQMLGNVSMFDGWDEARWQPCWIPFLSNGGGDHLCVASDTFGNIPTGSVIWYDHETSDREIVHTNFAAFLNDLYDRMINDRLECG
jgi:cell wall assembly regulator SMI1